MAAQTVTARLSVNVLSLDEGDASTDVTVTATLSQAASAATTITLALPTTRPTSPFLLPGMTIATQGASGDYTTTFDATTHTITIAANQTSGTTTFNIDPSTDKIIDEDDETIIITGTGTGLSVLPTEVYLEDGPYVAFPSMVYTHIYYHSASVSIVVPAVTGAVGTVTYSLTGTAEDVTAAPNLTFTASSRTLAGTAHSAAARTRYTITATDDMGTTTGTNPTDDDKDRHDHCQRERGSGPMQHAHRLASQRGDDAFRRSHQGLQHPAGGQGFLRGEQQHLHPGLGHHGQHGQLDARYVGV